MDNQLKRAKSYLSWQNVLYPQLLLKNVLPMKRVKTNVSFLRHALSNNEKFDVDVTKSNGDWSVQIHHPATNYSYRLLTPPCPVKWSDLAPGGNKGRFDPPITISVSQVDGNVEYDAGRQVVCGTQGVCGSFDCDESYDIGKGV